MMTRAIFRIATFFALAASFTPFGFSQSDKCVAEIESVLKEINKSVAQYPHDGVFKGRPFAYPRPEPALVFSVLWIESEDRNCLHSDKNAYGIAQFQLPTAKEQCGLTDFMDMPANVACATKYLSYLERFFSGAAYKGYNRQHLVVAAYNAGEGNVEHAVKTFEQLSRLTMEEATEDQRLRKMCVSERKGTDPWLCSLPQPVVSTVYVRDVTHYTLDLARRAFKWQQLSDIAQANPSKAAVEAEEAAKAALLNDFTGGWESRTLTTTYEGKADIPSPCASWSRFVDANYLRVRGLDGYVSGLQRAGGFVLLTFKVGSDQEPVNVKTALIVGGEHDELAKKLLSMIHFSYRLKSDNSGCEDREGIRQFGFIFLSAPSPSSGSSGSWSKVLEALGDQSSVQSLAAIIKTDQQTDLLNQSTGKLEQKTGTEISKIYGKRVGPPGETTLAWRKETGDSVVVHKNNRMKVFWDWPPANMPLPEYLGPCHDKKLPETGRYDCYYIVDNRILYVDRSNQLPALDRSIAQFNVFDDKMFHNYQRRGPLTLPFLITDDESSPDGQSVQEKEHIEEIQIGLPLADSLFASDSD
jgi:Transglycosylase SLT domain